MIRIYEHLIKETWHKLINRTSILRNIMILSGVNNSLVNNLIDLGNRLLKIIGEFMSMKIVMN
jgi:hypothetical protein